MRWAIGDIHGMLAPLRQLVGAVRAVDPQPLFCFAGDYVNRGPESRGVVDFLLTLPDARFARGNHDDVFDLVLHDQSIARDLAGGDRRLAFKWFLQHGLDATLASYGVAPAALEAVAQRPSYVGIDRLLAGVPEAHRQFFRGLPAAIEFDDAFVAHAKWPADEPTLRPGLIDRVGADPGLARAIVWGRFDARELEFPKRWGRRGFFGHTPVDLYADPTEAGFLPVVAEQMVLLDTAAALAPDGRLTAFCLDTDGYLQVERDGTVYAAPPAVGGKGPQMNADGHR